LSQSQADWIRQVSLFTITIIQHKSWTQMHLHSELILVSVLLLWRVRKVITSSTVVHT